MMLCAVRSDVMGEANVEPSVMWTGARHLVKDRTLYYAGLLLPAVVEVTVQEKSTWWFLVMQAAVSYFRSMVRGGAVYIMTNQRHTVYYTGVTSDLQARVLEHRNKRYPGSFTARYNIDKLVYYEAFPLIVEAIGREKQIKKYRREKKIALIEGMNPEWVDLLEEVMGW